jgi:hypothetical protein
MSNFTEQQYAFFVDMFNNQNKIEKQVKINKVTPPKPPTPRVIPR